jgi:hypothetical protein
MWPWYGNRSAYRQIWKTSVEITAHMSCSKYTVTCRLVARQRPRKKQLCSSHYWVTASQTSMFTRQQFETATWAQNQKTLLLFTFCSSSINTITKPYPVYSHSKIVTICFHLGRLGQTVGWEIVLTCRSKWYTDSLHGWKKQRNTHTFFVLMAQNIFNVGLSLIRFMFSPGFSLPQIMQLWLSTFPLTLSVHSSLKITDSRKLSSF